MLHTIVHGVPTARPPLIIAHGLYGSARNWGGIAKRLSDTRQVVAVDMRNHGASPWTDSHTYPDMAQDLAEVVDRFGGQAAVLGHSMGGKAAMVLALVTGANIRRLIVADIAPVAYTHSQLPFIDAMRRVDLSRVSRRSEAEQMLAELGVDKALQSFFTQSLDVKSQRWMLNLDVLARDMPRIMGFPDVEGTHGSATLFLTGGASDYVTADHRAPIKALFPAARFAKIPQAGHWLHAERPREFEATVRAFLDA